MIDSVRELFAEAYAHFSTQLTRDVRGDLAWRAVRERLALSVAHEVAIGAPPSTRDAVLCRRISQLLVERSQRAVWRRGRN